MADIERWQSREVDKSLGFDGWVETETYTYLIDESIPNFRETWSSTRLGEPLNDNSSNLRLTHIHVLRHYSTDPDRSLLTLTYSTGGTEGPPPGAPEQYIRGIPTQKKKIGTCDVGGEEFQHDMLQSDFLYGIVRRIRRDQFDFSTRLDRQDSVNSQSHGIFRIYFPAHTMLYQPFDVQQVGHDLFRVTDEWVVRPSTWKEYCPDHQSKVTFYPEKDMTPLLILDRKP